MSKTSSKTPEPPRHGRVIAGAPGRMTATHMRKHLAELTAHANEVKDYGGHGTACAQGGLTPGSVSGAEYQTSSADSAGDIDSMGPTGY